MSMPANDVSSMEPALPHKDAQRPQLDLGSHISHLVPRPQIPSTWSLKRSVGAVVLISLTFEQSIHSKPSGFGFACRRLKIIIKKSFLMRKSRVFELGVSLMPKMLDKYIRFLFLFLSRSSLWLIFQWTVVGDRQIGDMGKDGSLGKQLNSGSSEVNCGIVWDHKM